MCCYSSHASCWLELRQEGANNPYWPRNELVLALDLEQSTFRLARAAPGPGTTQAGRCTLRSGRANSRSIALHLSGWYNLVQFGTFFGRKKMRALVAKSRKSLRRKELRLNRSKNGNKPPAFLGPAAEAIGPDREEWPKPVLWKTEVQGSTRRPNMTKDDQRRPKTTRN